jgi:hypothetical protein
LNPYVTTIPYSIWLDIIPEDYGLISGSWYEYNNSCGERMCLSKSSCQEWYVDPLCIPLRDKKIKVDV